MYGFVVGGGAASDLQSCGSLHLVYFARGTLCSSYFMLQFLPKVMRNDPPHHSRAPRDTTQTDVGTNHASADYGYALGYADYVFWRK